MVTAMNHQNNNLISIFKIGHLIKKASEDKLYPLQGRLVSTKSGHIALEIPKSIVQGVLDAISDVGIESEKTKAPKAYVPIILGKEINNINKIKEIGHTFKYTINDVKAITSNSANINQIWIIKIKSQDLVNLRRSYNLTDYPNHICDDAFCIIIGIRFRNKLRTKKSGFQKMGIFGRRQAIDLSLLEQPTNVVNVVRQTPAGQSFLELTKALFIDPTLARASKERGFTYLPSSIKKTNILDSLENLQRIWLSQSVAQDSLEADKDTNIKALSGIAKMFGKDPKNKETARLIEGAAKDITSLGSIIAPIAPSFWESLHGWRGSAFNLGRKIMQTEYGIFDPKTGLRNVDHKKISERTKKIFNELYGPKAKNFDVYNISADTMGDIYNASRNMGLLGNVDKEDVKSTANKLKSLANVYSSFNELLQDTIKSSSYNDNKFKKEAQTNPTAALQGADILAQGQLANIDPNYLAAYFSTLQTLGSQVPGGTTSLIQLANSIADKLEQEGLPRVLALQILPEMGVTFPVWKNFNLGQGFAGLTLPTAVALEGELRANAIKSPKANMLAATLALDDAGLIQKGTPAYDFLQAIKNKSLITPSGINIAHIYPAGWLSMMQASGVPPEAAYSHLSSPNANLEYMMNSNVINLTRKMQAYTDIAPMIQMSLGGILVNSGLAGAVGQVRPEAVGEIAALITDSLLTATPEEISKGRTGLINRLNTTITSYLNSIGVPVDPTKIKSISSSIYSRLDDTIRSRPDLKFYQNLQGMLTVHNPEFIENMDNVMKGVNWQANLRENLRKIVQRDWASRLHYGLEHYNKYTKSPLGLAIQSFGGIPESQVVQAIKNTPSFDNKEMENAKQKYIETIFGPFANVSNNSSPTKPETDKLQTDLIAPSINQLETMPKMIAPSINDIPQLEMNTPSIYNKLEYKQAEYPSLFKIGKQIKFKPNSIKNIVKDTLNFAEDKLKEFGFSKIKSKIMNLLDVFKELDKNNKILTINPKELKDNKRKKMIMMVNHDTKNIYYHDGSGKEKQISVMNLIKSWHDLDNHTTRTHRVGIVIQCPKKQEN